MSDFPSLNDLKKTDDTGHPSLKIATDEVAEKLQKKMGDVDLKQKEEETKRFAVSLGIPHIDLEKFPVSQESLRQVPLAQAKKLKAVCFYATPDEIRIGALDPSKEEVKELLFQVQERNHANGGLYVISKKSFDRIIKLYDSLPIVEAITKDVAIKPEDLEKVQGNVTDFSSLQSLIEKKSVTELVTYLLGAGLKLDASDIHIEAEEAGIVVRLRLDGILHDAAKMPRDVFKQLVSRIKLVSSLKINITDKPQDGRFTIKLESGEVDVRVSTIPTVYGESIVMRLLKQSRKGLTFDDLGLAGVAYERLKNEIHRPNGMIITTGPTGSGKTTTMYAILHILNKPGVKIITLEDPVEYKMEGVNQSQIDRTKEYTFAKGLKSMLRQDPDIAMVGEIRDLETADIAIQSALTGHLILSTIHTNSAAGAIPRFLAMGVKPFLLAPALNSVIGQRLVRKLCEACKKEIQLDDDMKKKVQAAIDSMSEDVKAEANAQTQTFYGPQGCDECNSIGYKGRLGIYEIFTMLPEIEQMILSGQVSEYEIEKIAVQNGMTTMVQDGILKALKGVTSVEEVLRVIE